MNEDIRGYRPSMTEACKAKCFDCTGNFADGRRDCKVHRCPLYSRMPYRKGNAVDYSWIFGSWSRGLVKEAEALKITNPREFALKKWGRDGKIRIPLRKVFRAKCFDCCADYWQPGIEKGRVDCGVLDCPLYYWAPYRTHVPEYDWMFDLDYSKKHRLAILALGYTKDEYLRHVLVEKDI